VLRCARCNAEFEEVRHFGADAVTVIMVARYDQAVALALLGPILDRPPPADRGRS
jgi:hypothetical protein